MARRYRQRAYSSASAQLEDIIAATEKRMIAVVRLSLQDVINEAQQSVYKGGRMRVDTGFLRASGQASLTGMPSGPTRGEKKEPGAYDKGDDAISATVQTSLQNLEIGNTFYFGWTAEYARYREVFDGFLEGALRHWGRIVAFNTDIVKSRIKK